ncbi:pilus assembly FimT family protein [Duganella callida]|uniref:Prepilin-type N-terminal cleavage/methylation domain-containing protein n=1 Tax=Duganella callida TaxID=2561932 RepID=A0A4Y9SJ11_9BURK|nr:prepilin-type N-terminal cleavage/methylation domain-containing protein [Duganella callida]TFW22393.1 prepilin-type N-terminal cleavage/methylation domain-containing protein [Duganella callida]
MNYRLIARRCFGFTMVELVVVLLLVGILAAIGMTRFFDNAAFENRAYADQVKTILRYAQKLAVGRNGPVFVRATPNFLAVCSSAACDDANKIPAPGGGNSASKATRTYCLNAAGNAAGGWMCEGRPGSVTVAANGAAASFGANGGFYFDGLGRPYNLNDAGITSTFATMTLRFTSGVNTATVIVNAESGYVQ